MARGSSSSVASFFIYLLLSTHPLEAMRKYKTERIATGSDSAADSTIQELQVALQELETGSSSNMRSGSESVFFTCEKNEDAFHRMTHEILKMMHDYKNPVGAGWKAMSKRASASFLLKAFRLAQTYEKAGQKNCSWVNGFAEKESAVNEILELNKEINPCTQNAIETLKSAPDNKEDMAAAFTMLVEGMQSEQTTTCKGAEPSGGGGSEEEDDNGYEAAKNAFDSLEDAVYNGSMSSSLISLSQSVNEQESNAFPAQPLLEKTQTIVGAQLGIGVVIFLFVSMVCVETVATVGFIVGFIWCLLRSAMTFVKSLFSKPYKGYGRFTCSRCLRQLWRRIRLFDEPMDKQRYWQICTSRTLQEGV
jgi:hypothetical protein